MQRSFVGPERFEERRLARVPTAPWFVSCSCLTQLESLPLEAVHASNQGVIRWN